MNPNRVEGTAAAAWLVIFIAGLAIATVIATVIACAIWAIVTHC